MKPHWSVSKNPISPDIHTTKRMLLWTMTRVGGEIVSVVFEDAGYEVLTAKDATEAMRLTEGVQLASIILDLNLNGEDGLELMKFFQCNQSGVPVILYTGMSHDDDTILAMLRQGAHQYVRKAHWKTCARPSRGRCCEFTKQDQTMVPTVLVGG